MSVRSDPGACPYCGGAAIDGLGASGTCGAFVCLYRRFCGSAPPATAGGLGSRPRRDAGRAAERAAADEEASVVPGVGSRSSRVLRSRPWADPTRVRRIAVVRPGQLGDLLLAMPGMRALKRRFPQAEITLLARPWALGLAERFPYMDRVVAVREPRESEAQFEGSEAGDHPSLEVGGSRYDLVLQIQGDAPHSARFALALGGRATVGFCRDEGVGRRFDLLLPMVETEPEVLRVLRLVHALGGEPDGVHLEFPLLPRDLAELEGMRAAEEPLRRHPLVAIHPGARAPARRWPLDRFAEVVRVLHCRWQAAVVLVGGGDEAPLAEDVRSRSGVPAVNLAGRLSLGGLAALLSAVDLFVGNDSGPAQLAAAVAPRSVRIFGPANLRRWAPLDRSSHRIAYRRVGCSPCDHWECPIDHRCLRWVGVEEVLAEVDSLMLEAGVPPSGSVSALLPTPSPRG